MPFLPTAHHQATPGWAAVMVALARLALQRAVSRSREQVQEPALTTGRCSLCF